LSPLICLGFDITAPRSILFLDLFFSLVNISLFRYTYREDHQRGKQAGPPETKVVEEGSAKRNITRKHDPFPDRKEKKQHGGAGGKGKWDELDDGTQ
jgi:hypothetical protein